MAGKSDWRNHPRWHLVILMPLLIFVIAEEDPISRALLATAILVGAARYGRESVKWKANSGQAQPAPPSQPQRSEGYR
ncbi:MULTISPECIES: hypothetical protein [unclassified Streptomyces]|uniref:hypothetical protein n=1 Tax=unclassified Streptomyces TaxID=2593676 RepID=UPI00202FE0D0|nr:MULTISPECIES: hypothetical protein [unclassified Streptomyces]MCM1966139.1 hypothetical protein [Streptomyces sp. G1]MCX5125769.1 hypothetical protein [Streptomyces sp. NBC_00347]MCX5298424.1 hypothetical protein [Streptomyces sp. NBC_00193]